MLCVMLLAGLLVYFVYRTLTTQHHFHGLTDQSAAWFLCRWVNFFCLTSCCRNLSGVGTTSSSCHCWSCISLPENYFISRTSFPRRMSIFHWEGRQTLSTLSKFYISYSNTICRPWCMTLRYFDTHCRPEESWQDLLWLQIKNIVILGQAVECGLTGVILWAGNWPRGLPL